MEDARWLSDTSALAEPAISAPSVEGIINIIFDARASLGKVGKLENAGWRIDVRDDDDDDDATDTGLTTPSTCALRIRELPP